MDVSVTKSKQMNWALLMERIISLNYGQILGITLGFSERTLSRWNAQQNCHPYLIPSVAVTFLKVFSAQ